MLAMALIAACFYSASGSMVTSRKAVKPKALILSIVLSIANGFTFE